MYTTIESPRFINVNSGAIPQSVLREHHTATKKAFVSSSKLNEWPTSHAKITRTSLTFKYATFPLMFLRMRVYLGRFHNTPFCVFKDIGIFFLVGS